MTPVRRAVALVVVLAFLALSTAGAGWVICAGADGHVAVEALTSGCCGDEHDDGPSDRGEDRDCGDCEDVLLARLAPSRLVETEPPDVAVSASALPSPALRAFHVEARCAPPLRPRGPPHPPPLARHVASTVLRL